MKLALFSVILFVTTIVAFTSCSSDEGESLEFEDFTELDFGDGTYRPNPFKFCDNIPPFSWMGMPDTVKKETVLEIQFNEDAIRSKSIGELTFVDTSGETIDEITFDNVETTSYSIPARAEGKIVHISYTVDPEIGDSILQGYIVASGIDLDEANGQYLDAPIAQWKLTHNIGINWLRWAVFVVIVAALLYILYLLGCLIYGAIVTGIDALYQRYKKHQRKKKKNKKKDKKDSRIVNKLLRLEQRLYTDLKICRKYDILEKMRLILEKVDDETYLEAQEKLKANTWMAYENAKRLWDPAPINNVTWIGWKKRTCILNETHTLYNECHELKFTKCKYDKHGSPDFDSITFKGPIVDITDLYEDLSCEALKKRGGGSDSLQELAQKRMAKKLGGVIKRWAKNNNCEPDFWKWRDAHDLVPHEDTNCRTMRLVYRPAHTAFKHRGGISNAINIKSHFNSSII